MGAAAINSKKAGGSREAGDSGWGQGGGSSNSNSSRKAGGREAGVGGAGIEVASAGGMLIAKRQQVVNVEEGLSCSRVAGVGGGGSNSSSKVLAGGVAGDIGEMRGAAATGRLVAERPEGLARIWRSQAGWGQHQQQGGWWQSRGRRLRLRPRRRKQQQQQQQQ